MPAGLGVPWLLPRERRPAASCMNAEVPTRALPALPRSDNLEDALQKLQEIFDAAWVAVQPIEEDPEKAKAIEKTLQRGNERRLDGKKKQADKKKDRRAKIDW